MASFKAESLRADITSILSASDKEAVSAKAVRKALQDKYPDLDVKTHKKEIDALTVSIFSNEIQGAEEPVEETKPKLPKFSKIKKEQSPEPASSPAKPLSTSTSAAPKKVKREREVEAETDEMMARRLQQELNGTSTGRATRNGGTTAKKPKSRKKKSKSTVSDGESGDEDGKPKKKRKVSNTGFNKPHLLSPEMSDVCGKQVLSRPGVTKAMWAYIKANNLQDPNKKTDILPDATLKRVLPFDRINSFTMAKHVSAHLFPFDPEEHGHLVEDDTLDDSKPSKELIDTDDEDEK
ncbi:uncharacterized protein JCM6883_003038 [Sporobolomyces salmoneus]|uniref:uncharacterized protein n=1 Tax=Sporobolomyces salmoneus TaxID=183962 RepID=UPI00316D02A4